MATISEIEAQAAKQNAIKFVDRDKIGFSGMTSEDFMKLLITQLQNQDPSNPMDSDQLLNQVSQMRSLQANLELESAMKGLTLSQQLSSASNLIGKTITAVTGDQDVTVKGEVESVLVKDGKTLLRVDGQNIPMDDITGVEE
ncbi:MAG TPA: flagellar hook capping FlgD N-terminal domain-containing protein [Planctomycetaceae bacterium]|nr:flagellar hook capping FlgD N-terminal domain-containing protein [Planctomycetaceae bacterium]